MDGDVRHGLCRDLGFSDADRRGEYPAGRRSGQPDGGRRPDCLTAFISPHRAERPTGKSASYDRLSRFMSIRRWLSVNNDPGVV
ncbi:adenylyl-sulfate kinase [Salmonella enterica subsp. enterica]|nr:adenylyl-sulfate kinase [Salmonella enterica subsp. enterica]